MVCKCCKKEFYGSPALHYENMPCAAQSFPTKEDLSNDSGKTLDLYQCPYCGLVQLSCEPVSYYRDVIRASSVSPEMTEFRAGQFSAFIKGEKLSGGTIAEFGAGKGEYISIIKSLGEKVYAIEHNPESCKVLKEKEIPFVCAYPDSMDFKVESAPFEGIICLNFLEHAPNPDIFLNAINTALKDDGAALIEVPNASMILNTALFTEFISDHLMYFTKETFKTMLETNGFEIISLDVVYHDYILSAVVKKRKRFGIKHFEQQRVLFQTALDNFLKTSGKTLIWGAGHQALATMSIFELQKKVPFVIDSASFKQNKYTPASHIPIVSPDEIENIKPDSILVFVGGYNNEVCEIIHKRWPNINTAVLETNGIRIVE